MRVGVRDYDSGLGRFLSVDPVLDVADPVQWNPYVYADNSPVTKSDPSGLRPVDFTAEMWKAHKAARSHGASRARADAAAFGTPSGRAGGNAHVSRRGISSALLRRLGLSSYEDAEANVRAATRWNRLPDPGPLPPTHAEQVGPVGTVVEVLATAAVVLFAPEVVAAVVANPWAVVTAIADSYAGGSMLAGSAGAAVGSAALRYEANLTTKTADDLIRLSTKDSWANLKTLDDHFARHGADFGAKSADDYASMASEFFQRGGAQQFPTKIASDGTIRMFDPATNTFGSFAPNGMTKTFFKPTSPTYWARQPGVLR